MADLADQAIEDAGIDKGIERLTPERIMTVVRHVLSNESAARLMAYLETCMRCGLCAEACHTYLSRDRDPDFSPVAKVKNTLWELVRHTGRVSPDLIKRCRTR